LKVQLFCFRAKL